MSVMYISTFLGNFLSGMETLASPLPFSGVFPLETSLVEWKHLPNSVSGAHVTGLGNFLSGMETGVVFREGTPFLFPWKLP